ncbi:MAG: hypothetical protein RJA61_521 [Candidatus Parcubacteria bacterium]|jgi:hypothetical protein
MTTRTGSIDTGPNLDRLRLAHSFKFTPEDFGLEIKSLPHNGRIRLRFEIYGIRGSEAWLIVDSMGWEDGSGDSWNIEGVIVKAEGKEVNWPFKAYYNTKSRKGHIEFETK